ncbi:MAG: carboxypeptidase-like regulatory domain-containing protein [Terracidiphilus sp.]
MNMTRLLSVVVFISMSAFAAGQSPRSQTTVCEIAAHPQRFAGRVVTVRAKVVEGFEAFAIEDPTGKCPSMWLQYAGGSPSAMMSMARQTPTNNLPPLELRKDTNFDKFQSLLDAEMYPRERGNICMSCNRWDVFATLTGRVDVAPKGTGYGHLNAYGLQFELQSVSDVVGKDLAGNYDSTLFSPTPIRFPTGYFSGVVRSPSGDPVKGIDVTATRTDDVPFYLRQVSKWTDDEGKFQLDVPPGSYLLGVNIDEPVVAKFPYSPTYFPNATERTSAKVLTVVDEQTITTDLNIPRMAIRSDVTLKVEWQDGRPAEGVQVWLRETRTPASIAGTGQVTHTDEHGVMTIPAFEGFAYTAHAETNVLHPNSYEHFCAQPVQIDQSGAGREVVLKLSIKGEDACRVLYF